MTLDSGLTGPKTSSLSPSEKSRGVMLPTWFLQPILSTKDVPFVPAMRTYEVLLPSNTFKGWVP